ncbi:hypothetical protein [Crossiella sp. CA198]|uniref:hypothetical protein n=1 Tax=Crossiella sp. CA198 TaxID=3455607 RepID=UPI003F8CFFA0
MRRTLPALALLLTACATPPPPPAPAPPSALTATSTSAAPASAVAIPDLQARWWTWASSRPEATNPVADRTGAHCALDQPRDVWLLAGSFGENLSRRCTVPADLPLAGPVVNLVADKAGCTRFLAAASGQLLLNGERQEIERIEPTEITFRSVAGNPVTQRPGRTRTHGCGLWFTLPRLKPGRHSLVITGRSADFALEVTYDLTVSART